MMALVRHALLAAMVALAAGPALAQVPVPAPGRAAVLDHLGRGTAAFRTGDMSAATEEWQAAIGLARQIGASDLVAEALVRRGEAYRVAGHLPDADADLQAAVAAARQSRDPKLIAAATGALGSLDLAERHPKEAEALLAQSRDLARQSGDRATLAASSNDLGNLYAADGRPAAAEAAYREATANAVADGDETLAATGEVNAARLALQRNDPAAALRLLTGAVARLEPMPPAYEPAMVLVSAGSVPLDHAGALSGAEQALAGRAFRAAAAMAAALHNAQLASLAGGGLGRLAERAGQPAAAAEETARAVFTAQQAGAPELSYRWDWQQARLARQRGDIDGALGDYRRAVAALQSIRQDIPVEYTNGQSSYRVTFGPLYRQFADLLLQRARSDPAQAPALLREARDTIEALKESELQDYYRDSCVANFMARKQSVDTIAAGSAVLYPIALPDRLELLVSFGRDIRQFTVPVSEARLRTEVTLFRELLEKRTTNQYLVPAELLYNQLIRPIDPLLQAEHIDTLVVVPDDVFRTIPFAALFDGRHFLIDRYATAIAPSMHLVAPRPLGTERPVALVLGISQSVQGFVGLPDVPQEMAEVHRIVGGETLLNSQFTRAGFAAALRQTPFNIVHIASHGTFGSRPGRTFLLAYDGPLTMDNLETDIKYGKYRESPLELLVLSACQTASGDDRAALGLAGVALKAGARSALASLWYVSDQASEALVADFYKALRQPGMSKARALQTAQRQLEASLRYAHPAYWAPFLLIGNWL